MRSFSQKVCPFCIKLDFLIFFYLFFIFQDFFYFFVNLYPTAPTKCCIPHCCHQMLYPTLLSPNVVYRFVATKCRKLDKKNDYRRWGGGKKNDFWWFYTPLVHLEICHCFKKKVKAHLGSHFLQPSQLIYFHSMVLYGIIL